jgi:hypothetical protein
MTVSFAVNIVSGSTVTNTEIDEFADGSSLLQTRNTVALAG